MATPHPGLYRKGRYWYYIISANGQRAHGSTRATDLATARKVLEEKRRALIDGQLKRPTRIVLVSALVQEWLRVNRANFSQGHLSSAECSLRRWVVPVIGNIPVSKVNTAQVMELRARMLEAKCSGTYANNTIKTLKAIFNFGIRLRYLQEMPFLITKLRVQKKPRAIVPASRVQEFLSTVDRSARNPHLPVIIRLMVGLGLREAEALGARWEWFDPERKTYTVGKSKNRDARVIPVPDWLWEAIFTMPKTVSEWVFPAADGKPHRAQFCKKALQRVCKKLNLGNVSAHRLRATFASIHAVEAGTPITEIQTMLGHRSVTTTAIYIETSLDAKRRAQNALSQKLGLS
jgi:integrase